MIIVEILVLLTIVPDVVGHGFGFVGPRVENMENGFHGATI